MADGPSTQKLGAQKPGTQANWVEAPADDVGDAIIAALSAGGVDHLFFTSGSEIGFFQEATAKQLANGHNKPLRLITVPLEHISLNAALGFAAVTGRPAVTAAHVDCGTLHYGGAIHTAWRSGLPVIMTAGYPPTSYAGELKGGRDEGGHLWMQETVDQNGIVRNYTKWDHKLAWQDNPGLIMSRAIQVARAAPSGPVYLSFPKELVMLPIKGAKFPSVDQMGIPRAIAPDAGAVQELVERLVRAERPAVVVANSGRDPASVAPLIELCELLGIAVIDSVQRGWMNFPFRHPLYQAQTALPDADVVLVLESEVPWVPNRNAPSSDAWIAYVGHDPVVSRIPTYEFTADLRVTADPTLALKALVLAARGMFKDADKVRIAARKDALAKASAARYAATDKLATDAAAKSPIDPFFTSYQVGKLVTDNTLIVDDTLPGPRLRDYLPLTQPGSYIGNPGSSGGFAPGAAFGAKVAAPDKDVIAVTGDGFYQFGTPAPAIWAAAHHGAPFLTIVYTNRSYSTGTTRVGNAYGREGYAAKGGYEGGYFDPPIDFAKEAESAGGYGETVRDPNDLANAFRRGQDKVKNGTPAVISVWMKRLEAND